MKELLLFTEYMYIASSIIAVFSFVIYKIYKGEEK